MAHHIWESGSSTLGQVDLLYYAKADEIYE